MELHLHLTVAFRDLDRKWGKIVDLETPEDLSTCLPAVVDLPTTTFSSEEYLRTRRSKPYSRNQERKRKDNIKVNDSFRDISSARIPSVSDLEDLTSSSDRSSSEASVFSVDQHKGIEEYLKDYESNLNEVSTLDSELGSLKKNVFRQFKDKAKLFINRKCKKIC